ncbi:MAG: hypothetical protein LBH35_07965, partial [Treponema sp.]|nr:hypothetical protein [Treponema sp.]
LAIGGAGNPGETYRVYTVSGRILDRYGRNPGPNIGNGVEGYGYPTGEVFFRDGSAVQRFSGGVIVVNKTETVFVPSGTEEPAAAGNPGNADFSGLAPEIAGAFSAAAGEALGEESAKRSDGPVVSVVFSDPWIIGPDIPVSGLYIQSYDAGESLFVFVDAPALPKRARFLTGSFLTILLRSENRISGAENESYTIPVSGAETSYIKVLLDGFSLYGVPLSDRLPLATEPDEQGTAMFQEAQRFSKGWIVAPPLIDAADEPVSAGDDPVSDELVPDDPVPDEPAAVPDEPVPPEDEPLLDGDEAGLAGF